MSKSRVLLLLCAAAAVSCAVVFTRPSRGNAAIGAQHHAAPQGGQVPEHVAFSFLFRSTVTFRQRAAQTGKAQAPNTALQKEAGIGDVQSRILEEVASATLQEVDQQDARARAVIEAFRARYPGGVVPRAEQLPPPPPELLRMQKERDAILLRGRDRLRAAFGEQEFIRFHDFVMKRFAGKGLGEGHQQ